IEALLQEEPDNVTQIRRTVMPPKGRRFAFDAGEDATVEAAVADFFHTVANVQLSESQVREALRCSAASDIVLLWKQLDVVTRVGFTNENPEFYFIWRGTGAASTTVDAVVRKIVWYQRLVAKPKAARVQKNILSAALGVVLRPTTVAQQQNVSVAVVLEILNDAVSKGLFEL